MRTSLAIAPLSLAAAVAVAVGVGCGASGSQEGATPKKSPGGAAGRAVVLVQGIYKEKTTEVTGVVFEARQALVLTANHAMENAPNINVKLSNGTLTHARQVARAQCHDLAVLRLFPKPPGLAALPLARREPATIGEPVATLTYVPAGAKGTPALTRIQGTVSAVDVREKFPPLPTTGPFIAHQSRLLPSAAGSPVLDGEGRMIGLNTLVGHPRSPTVEGIEYALTSDYIARRLGQLRPGVGGALGGWGAEHSACHASLHNLIGKGHILVPNSAAGP
ncbi:MAG TPA: serine protease [Solirubrobacteraceae bacterium]|jgi:S1-C subfamily serine protease